MKKIITVFISSIMAISMIPSVAFATDEVDGETILEDNSAIAEDVNVQPEDEQDSDDMADEQEIAEMNEESLQTQSSLISNGKFYDAGDIYTMEDVSKYNKKMSIHAFYLGSGEYGEAVLIESNDRYLLMDTGASGSASKLVRCLNAVMGGNKKLDVYFSHMHGDHTGGFESILKSFDIGTVYFPDIELCENYKTPNTDKTIDKIYAEHVALAKKEAKVVYLRPDSSMRKTSPRAANTTSQFNVGGVICKVVGPVGKYKPDDFISYVKELNGRCGTKEGHCLNNSSLCTVLSCGDVKYLATGDIERQEETKLVKKYGAALDSDIVKLPHHGLRTSFSESFAATVTPMLSFVANHGFLKAYRTAIDTAKKYGYNYEIATKGHSVSYEVDDGKIRVFRDKNNNNKMDDGLLTGWKAIYNSYQYYDENGYISVGWQRIGADYYYFSGKSGCRVTGTKTIKNVECKFDASGKLVSPSKPKAPEISLKTYKGKRIQIKWRKTKNVASYQVFRSKARNGKYECIATVSGTIGSFSDTKLTAGKIYYYKVKQGKRLAGTTLYGSFSKAVKGKAKK